MKHDTHHDHSHHSHEEAAPASVICEVCGMVNCTMDHGAAGHAEHDMHAGHDQSHHNPNLFRNQFWFALALTVPAILYSHTMQMLLGFSMPSFPFSEYVPAVAGTILFFTGGMVFLKSGYSELKSRKPGMMALIALALVVAFGYSAVLTVFQIAGINLSSMSGMDFWWELASLVTIMLLGHWVEMSSVVSAQSSMTHLADLLPAKVRRMNGTQFVQVGLDKLQVGDVILVKPGEAIAADGVVVQGSSKVDESLVTGESAAVSKFEGDSVIGGTVNASTRSGKLGALTIRVTAVGDSTLLSGIKRLVLQAQASKSKSQVLADRAAGWLFYFAVVSALITGLVWTLVGTQSVNWVVERVVTVLVIACPHALGLAIPLVTAITTDKAARSGLIIRNRIDFEKAKQVSTVLFDKTGTLTTGRRVLSSVKLARGAVVKNSDQLLALAASVEASSEHPVASAIVAEANRLGLKVSKAKGFEAEPGVGVSATVGSSFVEVGSPAILTRKHGEIDVNDLVYVASANDAGTSVVFVVVDGKLQGFIELGDEVRENSAATVAQLKARGIHVAMVTGDSQGVADALARQLGIDEVFAEVLPTRKHEIVQQSQAKGHTVAFVGDGINDAPALAAADVGFAIGAGTEVALEAAGLALITNDPLAVVRAIDLSKRSVAKMRQNLAWGAGYNIVAVPLAAGLLFSFGLVLSPALGAVLMSVSTVVVALNAQLLRR